MKILAVGCHPDDLEIGCYGTLAKYVQLGHEVSVCHVTNGNFMAKLNIFCQRAVASDLKIVRMTANGQNSHTLPSN